MTWEKEEAFYLLIGKSKDELQFMIEILEAEKDRLDEMFNDPKHYKSDLPRAKWDYKRIKKWLKALKATLTAQL